MNDGQTPALREAVENMANMREAYNNLSQAAEAYNTGKVQLAANITSKGVQANATETLPELAEKVSAIIQESYTIDGDEMYAKQLFGSLETSNYWNLYEVLTNLLSDGRLVSYGGILLAEYYKGYDSLALSGAGAGGAYVVSDKDENGQFKMYTEDTTHTWATEDDGKGNRWVAYCFADEYHDFQITDTNTSPRSIFIGRKIGNVSSLVAGRCSQVVIPDGNSLQNLNISDYDQNWGQSVVIRNLEDIKNTLVDYTQVVEKLYVQAKNPSIGGGSLYSFGRYKTDSMSCIIFEAESCTDSVAIVTSQNQNATPAIKNVYIKIENGAINIVKAIITRLNANLHLLDAESMTYGYSVYSDNYAYKIPVFLKYKNNDRTKSVVFSGNGWMKVEDLTLTNGWCKPLNISVLTALTEENIVNHIFNRLGYNSEQSPLTITLGATNLAKLTAEEIAIATNKGFTLA